MGAVSPGLGRKKGGTETARPHTAEGQEVFHGGDGVEMMADVQHTPEQRRVIAEYESSTNPLLLDFVNRVRSREGKSGERIDVSPVSPRAVNDIAALTGVNVDGSNHRLSYDLLVHNDKRHGPNGQADKTMADPRDVARV